MSAEIGFPHQYVRQFLNPDAVALDQVLTENDAKKTVHENELNGSQQFVRGGYLALESKGSDSVHRVGEQQPTACTWPSVSVSTRF